ncbi:MAG: acyltransferase [Lachnospiraceae bacterium]|nr:acyltransferase [Lachnospiraceae bacterium]
MNSSGERQAIDSLKGIAILGIMLVHSGCAFSGIMGNIANSGARGVQLMFMINGYLIFKSLDNAQDKGITLKQWYKGKIIRIIPLYWFFTILHLLIFGTGERFYLGPLKSVSWLNVVCNMLCVHGFFPYYINSINLNWFIADLAIWYLIAPLCYKLIPSLEKAIGCLLIIIPIDYAVLALAERYPLISNEAIWRDYVSILAFPAELPVILLGCTVYYMVKEGRCINVHKLTSYAGCFFALMSLLFLCTGSSRFSVYSNVFSFGICFAIVMTAQLANPMTLLDNPLFAIFGRHSYGIYLCHIFLISFINTAMGKMTVQTGTAGQIGKYLLICTVSLAASVCVEWIYESLVKGMSKVTGRGIRKV